jgi:DNA helicase-2/ATP-dependent DNA helicase PcrA
VAEALLQGLNEAQAGAVQAPDGPVLVLAGPGSGKTRVLTHRVAYLIGERGISPYSILAVTFTNKAAREMIARLGMLIGDDCQRLTIGTFHAACVRILRREAAHLGLDSSFLIYDSDDQRRLITQALKELDLDSKQYRPTSVHAAISRAKNDLIPPESYQPPTYWHEAVARAYERYNALLTERNALDFDDLLLKAEQLFREHADVRERYQRRYRHILVDEFQDTNRAQYELLKHLVEEHAGSIYVVGDEDQSIYSWRGADFRNVLRFRQDYMQAQVYLLEQNYRSTGNILKAARQVIARNVLRHDKTLWTQNPDGERLQLFEAYDEREEAEYVVQEALRLVAQGVCRLREIAVMFRTNSQSRALEDALMGRGVRYQLVGSVRFYQRREIKDVLAYLRLIYNLDDEISLLRIINVPSRLIGERTIEQLRAWAGRQGLSMGRALLRLAELDERTVSQGSAMGSAAMRRLVEFGRLLTRGRSALAEGSVSDLLRLVVEDTGYGESLRDGTEEGEERIANVREMFSAVERYSALPAQEALGNYLEEVALVSDVDELKEEADAITLLTLHAAKGLEYDAVFMVGMEEGLCPHSRSMDDPDQMEEERRLCYVGMTRARRRLYLVHTFRRTIFGTADVRVPSPFLADIPLELIEGKQRPPASLSQATSPSQGRASASNGRALSTSPSSSSAQGRRELFGRRREQVQQARVLGAERLDPPAERRRPGRAVTPDAGPPSSGRPARAPEATVPSRPVPEQAREVFFRAGEKVVHPIFGTGVVIASKLVGDDEEITVAFADKGVKRLMAQYARLEKVG